MDEENRKFNAAVRALADATEKLIAVKKAKGSAEEVSARSVQVQRRARALTCPAPAPRTDFCVV